MEISIEIKNRQIKFFLLNGKKITDSLEIKEEMKLAEQLLPVVDEFLKKNKLTPEEIKKIRVDSDQNDNFTTTRIAKNAAQMWTFSLKHA
jgi:uncharacterized protein YpuA (DUF1002 family)